jgi:parallel beta-helix repeat protein
MIENKAFENDVAGIYIGDSHNAAANLLRNLVSDNG